MRARTRVQARRWSYIIAAGTTGGWLTHLLMLRVGVAEFHPAAATGTTLLAVASDVVALLFWLQVRRMHREELRRAARKVAMKEVPRAWDAPTSVLQVVPPLVHTRFVTTYKTETYTPREGGDDTDRRIWADLAERTGDVGQYRVA
jgi:hypothetical protein